MTKPIYTKQPTKNNPRRQCSVCLDWYLRNRLRDGICAACRTAPTEDNERIITAKYPGKCDRCFRWFSVGTIIVFNTTTRRARHKKKCSPPSGAVSRISAGRARKVL